MGCTRRRPRRWSGPTSDVLVTDGPFAEAKEQLGGFWIITAPDLDVAMDWARRASVACRAPVEVRPFQDEEAVEDGPGGTAG